MLQNLNLSLLSYFSAYYMHHLTQTDTVPIYHITDLQYIVTDSYHLQHIPFLSNTIFTTFFIQKKTFYFILFYRSAHNGHIPVPKHNLCAGK